MVTELEPGEARARARRVRAVLSDVDGVLTDGAVYCSAAGEELLRFSRRDGMGVERLRAAGIETILITRERSPIVEQRASKLRVRLFAGVLDKRALLGSMIDQGLPRDGIAYIGDDVNDVEAMRLIVPFGITAAPSDAEPQVLAVARLCCTRPGGHGAFRELAEWILSERA